jgi:hypothetical protein
MMRLRDLVVVSPAAREMLCCEHTWVNPCAIFSRGTVAKFADLESSFTTVMCEHAEAMGALQCASSDATLV